MGPTRHILHVFPSLQSGGAQVRTIQIVNALSSEFRHTFIAMDGATQSLQRIDPGVPYEVVEAPRQQDNLTSPFRMARILKSVRPDLAITYNWGAMDTVIGAALSGFSPVIHTEDGFGADEAARLKPRRVITRHLLLNRIALTVVISKTLLTIARDQYKLAPGKVRFIPNGVDTAQFQPQTDRSMRRKLGIADDTLLFGYIGRLGWEKNLPWLVRAFCRARLDNAKLILVGDGPVRPQIEATVQELGANQRVILPGPSNEPAACVAAFDVLAMSSFTEQASLALLEAMACGLPVVCTDVGDSREMLVRGQSRFVVPLGDEEAYVRALRDLAADPALRSRLGRENRTRCLEVYSLDGMIAAYRDLYSNVIAGGTHNPS